MKRKAVFSAKKGYYFNNDNVLLITAIFYTILAVYFLFMIILISFRFKDKDMNKGFLCFTILVMFFGVIFSPMLIKDKKMNKYLKECLKDSVELKADIVSYDYFYDKKGYIINFTYNDKEMILRSNVVLVNYFNKAYFNKFTGKNIDILYSPKYDDVLLLNKKPTKRND